MSRSAQDPDVAGWRRFRLRERSVLAGLIALTFASPAAGQEIDTPHRQEPAETCVPAHIPFDADAIRLTGRWSADDGGMYYIRHVGDEVWWNGMSGYERPSDDLGREFANVAHGTLKGEVLGLDFADVPRGNIWGHGRLSIRVEAGPEGELRLRRISGDFGGTIFTPCAPEIVSVEGFARPYTYAVPFGIPTATLPGATDLQVLITPDIPETGLAAWLLGPGWSRHCSLPDGVAPLEPGIDGLLGYLRSHPDLEIGEPIETSVDGRPAISVEITNADGASGCHGDQRIRIWKESDNESHLPVGARSRMVILEVEGATIAFEIWSPNIDLWLPQAQSIIDTVRFDPGAAMDETIGETADGGARVIRVETLDERTRDLTVESPSVGYAKVRILLPEGFEEGGTGSWPILYLLHGAFDDYTSWTRETDVEELAELSDVLVVMPTAGTFGWYSDWWNAGDGGIPAWETFHTEELPQLLERNWQASDERVIAGLSMGGFGAMSYAARHPGMFAAAASYSGVLDTLGSDFQADILMWGDKAEQADIWAEHNPTSLADKLDGIPLYISYGNGQPGPLDQPGWSDDGLEGWVEPQNAAFVARLEELGIKAMVDAYGDGLHTWPYWERGLHESLPMLLTALEQTPSSTPSPGAPAVSAEVQAFDLGFDPPELRLPAGQTSRIVLHNVGRVPHNLTVDALGILVVASRGGSAEVAVNDPPAGTYEFYCSISGHKEAGMVGKLVVE